MSNHVQTLVIGAGVVGLAIARRLARAGHEVIIAEAGDSIGAETSSRNSEVIHAGIYYPTDSLKARLCVRGKQALYEYCASHGVGHRRIGKLVVAASASEIPFLEALLQKGRDNGVDDLSLIDGAAAMRAEPSIRCAAALHSPSTGIVDSHGLMLAYQGDAEAAGALIAFNTKVIGGAVTKAGFDITVRDRTGGNSRLSCTNLINSAGLGAWDVARNLDGLAARHVPPRHLSKGVYFTLPGRAPFDTLIYPVPRTDSLGIHATLDLGGQCRFGPDAEWVNHIDYTVEREKADKFYAAIRRYYPALGDGVLQPGYAGVRPKTQAPGDPPHDFAIAGPASHGIARLVNLFGIESPGLTASLAIADHAAKLIGA